MDWIDSTRAPESFSFVPHAPLAPLLTLPTPQQTRRSTAVCEATLERKLRDLTLARRYCRKERQHHDGDRGECMRSAEQTEERKQNNPIQFCWVSPIPLCAQCAVHQWPVAQQGPASPSKPQQWPTRTLQAQTRSEEATDRLWLWLLSPSLFPLCISPAKNRCTFACHRCRGGS